MQAAVVLKACRLGPDRLTTAEECHTSGSWAGVHLAIDPGSGFMVETVVRSCGRLCTPALLLVYPVRQSCCCE